MKKKQKQNLIPIKYMLSIPVTMVDLRDEKGNQIEVVNLTQYKGGLVVIDKKGRIFSDKSIVLK